MYQHNSHEDSTEREYGIQCTVASGHWKSERLDLVDLVCDCFVRMGPVAKSVRPRHKESTNLPLQCRHSLLRNILTYTDDFTADLSDLLYLAWFSYRRLCTLAWEELSNARGGERAFGVVAWTRIAPCPCGEYCFLDWWE